jgi:MFS family permease
MAPAGHPATMPSAREHRARRAATAIFFLTGWVYAAWASRIPAVKEGLHLPAGALGLAVLGLEAGAIVGLPLGGALVARLGSRRALRSGFVAYPMALVAVAWAPGLGALAVTLAAMAAATSLVDVAVNTQGIELEKRFGRPILSGLHAGHPFGLAAGGIAGAGAAAADVPVRIHFAAAAAIGLAGAVVAVTALVEEHAADARTAFARPGGRLALLGLAAFCVFLLDGSAYTWSAVHLRVEHHAAAWLAAGAFTLFSLALAFGRLLGDRLVTRLGRVRVVQACGAMSAAGSALAIATPTVAGSLAGWALFGVGLAALAPTILGAAPATADVPAAVAIAAVTTIGYLGSFTGPPAIGALAGLAGLSTALGVLIVVSAGLVALAPAALGDGDQRVPDAR